MVEAQTAVVTKEQQQPAMTSIIAGKGNFARYMLDLIGLAERDVAKQQEQLDELLESPNVGEVAEAKQALEIAEKIGEKEVESDWHWELSRRQRSHKIKIARRRRELKRSESFLGALREGYVPIPRLPAVRLDLTRQLMPPEVLELFAEAKEEGVFEEFRIIDGTETTTSGHPTGGSRAQRDPILVGMIGNEMFAVAWWRPAS